MDGAGGTPKPGALNGAPDFTLGGGLDSGSELSLVGGDGGGTGDEDCESIHALLLLLVFGFAVLLVVVVLGGGADRPGRDGGGGTVMPLREPVIGSAGSSSRSEGEYAALRNCEASSPCRLAGWRPDEDRRLPPAREEGIAGGVERSGAIGLSWLPRGDEFRLIGVPVGGFEGRALFPLIAGIPPGLPGIVIAPLVMPRFGLPFIPLAPRESGSGAAPVELGEPRAFAGAPGAPARAEVELFDDLPCESRCVFWSALPPAYGEVLFCLQQLHPVSSMPMLQAPIRLAKGILPIGISSPA